MNNLDPRIAALLKNRTTSRNLDAAIETIAVFIRYQDDFQPLEDLGLQVRYYDDQVVAGLIPLDNIASIAAHPHVIFIEKSDDITFSLDKSIKEINADQVRSVNTSTHVWTGQSGKGVIIGIIDIGINYLHQSFRDKDGKTRIKFIWDKSLTAKTGEAAPTAFPGVPSPGGVEYQEDKINEALSKSDPLDLVRHTDSEPKNGETNRHGSHVTGIAAGNGLQDDRCTSVYKYTGVAPEANLIIVKIAQYNSIELVEALRYIFHKAGTTPVVVNFSGHTGNLGPHDGSTFFDTTIDGLLTGTSGKAFVQACGNNGNKNLHLSKTVSANDSLEFEFNVQPGDNKEQYLDIWYPGAGRLKISIKPEQEAYKAEVSPGDPTKTFVLSDGTSFDVNSSLNDARNHDNEIYVVFDPKGKTNRSGTWKVKLANTQGTPVTFHAWFNGHGSTPYFNPSDADQKTTITNPGTNRNIITVGSFAIRGGNNGGLSDFSSRGPTRDGRSKPDITAPGEAIISARGEQPGCCNKFWCWCCNIYHYQEQGTSMAAPHVAGAIALMLEKKSNLTFTEIRNFLQQGAKKDGHTTPTPDVNLWGAGKLDIKATMNLVPNAPPAPAPGGGNRNIADEEEDIMDDTGPIEATHTTDSEDLLISRQQLAELYDQLVQTDLGQQFARLGATHADEIWELVNFNKRVATVWHRQGGKVVMRKAMNALAFPEQPIPEVIEDISTRERLAKIASVFFKYGSETLKHDLSTYTGYLFPLIGMNMHEGLTALGKMVHQPYSFEPIEL